MKNIVVVSNSTLKQKLEELGCQAKLMNAEDYFEKSVDKEIERPRIYNLCNDYSYCKKGYYTSLLAEARGHRPLPSMQSISDLHSRHYLKLVSEALEEALKQSLKGIKADSFEISVYFGKNMAQRYSALAKQLFAYFQAPMVRAYCVKKNDEWQFRSVQMISLQSVPEQHYEFLVQSMNDYFGLSHGPKKASLKSYKYDLAILYNPEEEIPPSDKGAIEGFMRAAKDLRMSTEIITGKDIGKINRFDALFIRETTDIMNHTFRIAKKADMEGLVVIDDPQSIVRCCNKVFLHDLLSKKGISTPKTNILYKGKKLDENHDYPMIIKRPDSAFSAGVKKVKNFEELKACTDEFFKGSDLLITQEFMPTDFDWRIGVINNEPLYACKYFMSKGHWQIVSREGGKTREGLTETFDVHTIPSEAVKLALKACKVIGDGLYGVDIKEVNGEFYVIEVNDNPSLEKGCEDKILGHNLYKRIIESIYNRLESR